MGHLVIFGAQLCAISESRWHSTFPQATGWLAQRRSGRGSESITPVSASGRTGRDVFGGQTIITGNGSGFASAVTAYRTHWSTHC